MRHTPLCPRRVAFQKASRPIPLGLTAPIPVTTTRRLIADIVPIHPALFLPRREQRVTTKHVTLRLTGKDLKIDLHFVLHLDHSATYTDGLDSEIGLLEDGAGGVRVAGLLHGQADRLRDAVQ